ncbi:hypothetical protein ACO0QE_003297 [Hanseniaspora vineae]
MNTIKRVGTLSRSKSSLNTVLDQNSEQKEAKATRKNRRGKYEKNGYEHSLKTKQSTADILIAKPYEEMVVPDISKEQRKKVGSSMQRRLSVHLPKGAVPMVPDLSNAPALPGNMSTDQYYLQGTDQDYAHGPDSTTIIPKNTTQQHFQPKYNSAFLRKVLSDDGFVAREFVHDKLGDATAREIDNFTSSLQDLSLEIQDEIRLNMDQSYKEVIIVNKNLNLATQELKNLRGDIDNLNNTLKDFELIASKKLENSGMSQNQEVPATPLLRSTQEATMTSHSITSPNSLAQPISGFGSSGLQDKNTKERTSVLMLEKVWVSELNELWKKVEGAQKYVPAVPGRHIVFESADWFEMNAATLKPLSTACFIVLNDLMVIATKKHTVSAVDKNGISSQANDPSAQSFVVAHCALLKDVTISSNEKDLRLTVSFNMDTSTSKSVFQCREEKEFHKCIGKIRLAKDSIKEELYNEEQTTNKFRNSLIYLQSSPIPNNVSPRKSSHKRNTSTGNANLYQNGLTSKGFSNGPTLTVKTDKRLSAVGPMSALARTPGTPKKDDVSLLHTLSLSINARTKTRDVQSSAYQLKQIDQKVDSIDVFLSRKKFNDALKVIEEVEQNLKFYDQKFNVQNNTSIAMDEQDAMLRQIVDMKAQEKKTLLVEKLLSILQSNDYIDDMSTILDTTLCLVACKSISESTILDAFLSNRSLYIAKLVANIKSSLLNTEIYALEVTVVRFQTLKKTVITFNELFQNSKIHNQLSSTLVSWAEAEIDDHFNTLTSIANMKNIVSPSFIKSTRKQIDLLKSVGMDFVYKLDKFLQQQHQKQRANTNSASNGTTGLGIVSA